LDSANPQTTRIKTCFNILEELFIFFMNTLNFIEIYIAFVISSMKNQKYFFSVKYVYLYNVHIYPKIKLLIWLVQAKQVRLFALCNVCVQ